MTNLFLSEVLDVKVYNENGDFITNLDKVSEGELIFNLTSDPVLLLNIANFDLNLVKAIGDELKVDYGSDFSRDVNHTKSTLIKFKNQDAFKHIKYFKLIAEANLRNPEGEEVIGLKIIIDKAMLTSGLDLGFKHDSVSGFTHAFKIISDENDDAFTLEVINRALTKETDEDVLVKLLSKIK